MIEKSAADQHFSTAEAAKALRRIGGADLLRLQRVAQFRASGIPHVEWEDLLHTAIERVIGGTRKWPKNIPLVQFTAGVLRSLASECWAQHSRLKDVGVSHESDVSSTHSVIDSAASAISNPERELLAKEELGRIEEMFIDDEAALSIVMAKAEGYSPSDIQETFDMSETEYASALRRIRRTFARNPSAGADE